MLTASDTSQGQSAQPSTDAVAVLRTAWRGPHLVLPTHLEAIVNDALVMFGEPIDDVAVRYTLSYVTDGQFLDSLTTDSLRAVVAQGPQQSSDFQLTITTSS